MTRIVRRVLPDEAVLDLTRRDPRMKCGVTVMFTDSQGAAHAYTVTSVRTLKSGHTRVRARAVTP